MIVNGTWKDGSAHDSQMEWKASNSDYDICIIVFYSIDIKISMNERRRKMTKHKSNKASDTAVSQNAEASKSQQCQKCSKKSRKCKIFCRYSLSEFLAYICAAQAHSSQVQCNAGWGALIIIASSLNSELSQIGRLIT